MKSKLGLILTALLMLTIAACASTKKDNATIDKETIFTDDQSNAVDEANAYSTGYSKAELEALGIIGDPLNYNTVYFEYNRSAIDQKSDIIARAHARHLASRGGANVRLEGHADERGTRDYNLALGERRSIAVADVMRSEGAGSSAFDPVSFGEERPVNTAHNDAAWAENRRVKIVYE